MMEEIVNKELQEEQEAARKKRQKLKRETVEEEGDVHTIEDDDYDNFVSFLHFFSL